MIDEWGLFCRTDSYLLLIPAGEKLRLDRRKE